MKLMISLYEANEIFNEACELNPGNWINHSINVANLAREIAARASLDQDKVYILGLLHDIGRKNGLMQARHIIEGYKYMIDKSQEVARI